MKARRSIIIVVVVMLTALVPLCFYGTRLVRHAVDDQLTTMNSYELLAASAFAYSAGRTEDAGVLYFAGRARFQIDKQVYPPIETGSDSPAVLMGGLTAGTSALIQQSVLNDADLLPRVTERLASWTPQFGPDYDPGWEFRNALDPASASAIGTNTREQLLKPLVEKSELLENREYADLSRMVRSADEIERRFWEAAQAAGGAHAVPPALKDEYDAAVAARTPAVQRMKEIEWQMLPDSRWHARVGWSAEEFFEDEQVIELCRAIEADDIAEMEQLIAAGADVNALGNQGMTLLMWAFPERKLERFACLLRHGANPNVYFESDFGVAPSFAFHPYPRGGGAFDDRGCHAGQSVTHLAARSIVIEYLDLVLVHGGDANLEDRSTGERPLDIVMSRHIPETAKRVKLLLDKAADPNHYCEYTLSYPAMQAVRLDRYDAALLLLKSGADPELYQPDGLDNFVHTLVRKDRNIRDFRPALKADYESVVTWLEGHGESLDEARKDVAEWQKRLDKAVSTRGFARVREAIIAEREASK